LNQIEKNRKKTTNPHNTTLSVPSLTSMQLQHSHNPHQRLFLQWL